MLNGFNRKLTQLFKFKWYIVKGGRSLYWVALLFGIFLTVKYNIYTKTQISQNEKKPLSN